MNGIYEYMLQGTAIDIEDEKNKLIILETTEKKFTITRFNNGLVLIKIKKNLIPLIEGYIRTYKSNLFSKEAISYMSEHFKLECPLDPWEYIYGIRLQKELAIINDKKSAVKINLDELMDLNPNRFKKYPFKYPSDELIYFGTFEDREIVSLVSGYLGKYKAVELTGETLKEYRNNGYAKTNTFFITEYLLDKGYEVLTTNGGNNTASVKTVESLGFQKYGSRLAFFESAKR